MNRKPSRRPTRPRTAFRPPVAMLTGRGEPSPFHLRLQAGETWRVGAWFSLVANMGKLRPPNALEKQYQTLLEWRRQAGHIRAWWREPVVIHMGKGASYCPDFGYRGNAGQIVLVEVKGGHVEEDARVRSRIAAHILNSATPAIPYLWATFKKGLGWKEEKVAGLDLLRVEKLASNKCL